jgi:hypothetical protein
MIIGVTGKARSGKDTFAELLAEELYESTGRKFILMAYASELKNRVQKDFDLAYDQLWGDQKEVEDKRYLKRDDQLQASNIGGTVEKGSYWTPREIMQAYGQFFRTVHYNFWVDALFRTISYKEYGNVIITDVRHPNEADPIRDRGGLVIKVTRDNKDDIHGMEHISETAMDDYNCDFTICNDGDLRELKLEVKGLIKYILEGNSNG